ncbi:isocitrate lyase/PEP mutase family protein [Bradyrhizobium sp. 61]|uniref:isocitrate lyase/PEP mutase family protein n=1 Tax=unclassified Bradyrhizobium TaxID=2631580 RepID=UPI002112C9AA|nr:MULTISPECIES: isocitrate lyase/PEP mutase family protein [unclassified Bradyrhizobium]MCK1280993.1 isocitrate lyase/PEP mutase family protein [Bradyrhizobium sp. 61]MCK1446659.1 isocitrate lyase/PEP mutase family protein [Bradyrhizobium sp. 48]
MPARPTFQTLLSSGSPLVMPCAHDALSARLIQQAGFSAMAIGGSGALAARYGLPDLGIAGLADMSAITRDILDATSIACMGDGDDGYGDIKSVARTVQVNEVLGVGALVLEDQTRSAKRPGQNAALDVVSDDQIAAKLRIAVETRSSRDFWIIGRTDAYGAHGMEAELRRGELYLRCGVDGLFIAGVRKADEIERIGRTFRGTPLSVVVYGGEGWPSLSVSELHALGYTQILYPLALLLPMCTALVDALEDLKRATERGEAPPIRTDEKRARTIFANAVNLDHWMSLESAKYDGLGADKCEGPPR